MSTEDKKLVLEGLFEMEKNIKKQKRIFRRRESDNVNNVYRENFEDDIDKLNEETEEYISNKLKEILHGQQKELISEFISYFDDNIESYSEISFEDGENDIPVVVKKQHYIDTEDEKEMSLIEKLIFNENTFLYIKDYAFKDARSPYYVLEDIQVYSDAYLYEQMSNGKIKKTTIEVNNDVMYNKFKDDGSHKHERNIRCSINDGEIIEDCQFIEQLETPEQRMEYVSRLVMLADGLEAMQSDEDRKSVMETIADVVAPDTEAVLSNQETQTL